MPLRAVPLKLIRVVERWTSSFRLLSQPCALERHGRVTALALPAELPDVHIVGAVTRRAFGRRFNFVRGTLVTARASDFAMRAFQCEARLLCMIEFPNVPTVRRVTFGARCAESAFVNVAAFVAADASPGGADIGSARVTLGAGNGNMQADQWEIDEIVIECDVGTPTARLVATLAIAAELADVHVLSAMTRVACRAELLFCDRGRMTGVAVHVEVFADKCEFRIATVVEFLRLPSVRTMAAAAVVTHARCMTIVGRVAAVTVFRNVVLHPARFMA